MAICGPLSAKETDPFQVRSDPVVMVKRMFQAIQDEDLKTVRLLMWPAKFKTIEADLKKQGFDWKVWFDIWKKYPVKGVFGPPEPTGWDHSFRIRVEYGGIGRDSVLIYQDKGQDKGKWYWNEN